MPSTVQTVDRVILQPRLSGDVNTWLVLVSEHQATHSAFMNACVRKSPSGDGAVCVIPLISLLSRAEGGREGSAGVPRKAIRSLTGRADTVRWQLQSMIRWSWKEQKAVRKIEHWTENGKEMEMKGWIRQVTFSVDYSKRQWIDKTGLAQHFWAAQWHWRAYVIWDLLSCSWLNGLGYRGESADRHDYNHE